MGSVTRWNREHCLVDLEEDEGNHNVGHSIHTEFKPTEMVGRLGKRAVVPEGAPLRGALWPRKDYT